MNFDFSKLFAWVVIVIATITAVFLMIFFIKIFFILFYKLLIAFGYGK